MTTDEVDRICASHFDSSSTAESSDRDTFYITKYAGHRLAEIVGSDC